MLWCHTVLDHCMILPYFIRDHIRTHSLPHIIIGHESVQVFPNDRSNSGIYEYTYAIMAILPPNSKITATKLHTQREKKLDIYVVCVLSFFGRCLREGVKKILSLALLVPSVVALELSLSLSAFCWTLIRFQTLVKSHFQVNSNISCYWCCCCCCCRLPSFFYSVTLNSLSCCFSIVFLLVNG